MLFSSSLRWTESSGREHRPLEVIALRWQLRRHSPAYCPPLLSSLVRCQSFEAYTPLLNTQPPLLFPYFPATAFSQLYWMRLWGPWRQSGSLACRKEPMWSMAFCSSCVSSRVSGLSVEAFWCEHFKGLKRVLLNRLCFLAQDRVLLAIVP